MSKKFLTLIGMAVLAQCAQAQIIMITDPSIAAQIDADPRGDKIYAAPDGFVLILQNCCLS